MKEKRIERVLEKLGAMGLEQMVVADAISILYLTDIWVDAGERLVALYLNRNGKHCLFVNHMFTLPAEPGVEVVRFSDTDPYLELLGARIDREKVLGVDKVMPARFLLPLMEQGCAAGFVNSSLCVDETRAIKDEEEKEAMKRVSAINDQAMARFKELLKEGVTERQVAGQMKEIYQSLGADDLSFPPSVCFGANGAVGHYRCGDVALKPGDCVLMDVGCIKDHYCADMTRTFFFKKMEKEEHQRVYELVLAANRAAEAMVRPGVRFKDIDRAARNIIEEAGYGSCFTHRLGHFIGMGVHDYGDVSAANEEYTQAGQIFSIEPGIYLEGEMGVRIEDLVLVTEDGCEILNSYSRELTVVD